MKNVKVSDDVHAMLLVQSKARGVTMSDLIHSSVSGLRDVTDLDIVLEQMNMRFDALEGSPQNFFSENEKEEDESPEAKRTRLRLLEIEMKQFQEHSINHEEDCDQSKAWSS